MLTNLVSRIFTTYRVRKESSHYLKKIGKIPFNTEYTLNKEIISKFEQNWSWVSKDRIDTRWLQWYISFNGFQSADYVPENIYYTFLEPILNSNEFSKAYADKNFYDLIYPELLFPDTRLRNISGGYFDHDYRPVTIDNDENLFRFLKSTDRYIVKPSLDSGGGKKVHLFEKKADYFQNTEGIPLTRAFLEQHYGKDFLFQKVISCHPFLAQFNPTSFNTIRVFVLRRPGSNAIAVTSTFLRVGSSGNYIDNITGGGLSIGVKPNGELKDFAINYLGEKKSMVNHIDLSSQRFTIPHFDEIIETAKGIAERNFHHRVLGLDISIDTDSKIRCIEINNESVGINHCQLLSGPLFGNFTGEVIEYCKSNTHKIFQKYIPDHFKTRQINQEC